MVSGAIGLVPESHMKVLECAAQSRDAAPGAGLGASAGLRSSPKKATISKSLGVRLLFAPQVRPPG